MYFLYLNFERWADYMLKEEKEVYDKYLISPKKQKKSKRPKLPNGFGSIVTLSGNRRNPYMARPAVKEFDIKGYPVYSKPLGYFPEWIDAFIALVEYNKSPYDIGNRSLTFSDVYDRWILRKFGNDENKTSTRYCYSAAYKKCSSLHNRTFRDIRTNDMQAILDNEELSHATIEHITVILSQMSKYALEFDIIEKNYAEFTKINKEEDDEPGIPFTDSEVEKLWTNKNVPFVDTILIFIYSGWRINELAEMPLSDIDLDNKTYTGGLKTRASRNRVVPIANKIYPLVKNRYDERFKSFIYNDTIDDITQEKYRKEFSNALLLCKIDSSHTPHDCRHTFATMLDNAGVNKTTRKRLLGHANEDVTELYTHKDIDRLRKAINKI